MLSFVIVLAIYYNIYSLFYINCKPHIIAKYEDNQGFSQIKNEHGMCLGVLSGKTKKSEENCA